MSGPDRFVGLFAGLARLVTLESVQEQAETIAQDLISAGFSYVRVTIGESWHAMATAP